MIKVVESNNYSVGDFDLEVVVGKYIYLKRYNGNSKDITIPDEVTNIYALEKENFCGLENVEVIRFTKSSNINSVTFNFPNLRKFYIPDNIHVDVLEVKCENIDRELSLPIADSYIIGEECGKLSNIIFPRSNGEEYAIYVEIDAEVDTITMPDYKPHSYHDVANTGRLLDKISYYSYAKGININCKSEEMAKFMLKYIEKDEYRPKNSNIISINNKQYKLSKGIDKGSEEIDYGPDDFNLHVYKSDFSDHILYVNREGYSEFFTDLNLSSLRKLGLKFDHKQLLLKGNNSLITLKDLNSPKYLEGEPGDYMYELLKYLSDVVKEYFNKPAGRIYYFPSDSCYEDVEDLGLYDGESII